MKPSRTILNPRLAWPFQRSKPAKQSKRKQAQEFTKLYGKPPF